MRFIQSLILLAVAFPVGAVAQVSLTSQHPADSLDAGAASTTLAPLPTLETAAPPEAPAVALPPPAPVQASGAEAAVIDTPPVRPPVLVAKEENGLGAALGTTVGGVAGGAAGAAVAGPVGKFAGGFLGKRLFKGLLGGDDTPQVTAIPQTPTADGAGVPAADQGS
ncbi:MAG: hypothetical protein U1C74_13325 [Phenylobacterium sp.]|nr:hypothetical protein [Phenylobacterium sp.]